MHVSTVHGVVFDVLCFGPRVLVSRTSSLLRHEPVAQRADAGDVDLDDVAGLQIRRGAVGAHPDHVARREREVFR